MEGRVSVVSQYVPGSREAARVVDGGDGRQRAANYPLCCVGHSLQPLPISLGAVRVPGSHSVGQQALDGRPVEGHQQACVQMFSPEDPQEVEPLLGLLNQS